MKEILVLGRTKVADGFDTHTHPVWELLLFEKGTGIFQTPQGQFPFFPGAAFCIPPEYPHKEISNAPYVSRFVLTGDFSVTGGGFAAFRDGKSRQLYQLHRMMHEQYTHVTHNGHHILHLLYEAYVQYVALFCPKKASAVSGFVELLIKNVPNADFCVERAILAFGVAPATLRRQFLKATGMRPVEFLNQKRVENAKSLLGANKNLPVKELASLCGFDDPYYFSRVFKKVTGMSPTAWKNELLALQ